ncbi:hypothetical protein [Tenacibaculum dicentrarchi]|uniref:hypothetical protein n=1 Tax=Tenacibaculum dicentrarchi TaxID=669041 RepID=UPI0011AF0F3E
MKKITLLLLTIMTISCGNNKEEQMLYDYQSKGIKKMFNTNLKELDFKINSVEKVLDIKSSDSLIFFKNKLSILWLGKNADQKKKDTLTFEYVIKELDTLVNTYQSIIISNIRLGNKYKNYEYKEKRNKYIDSKVNAESWKRKSELYSKNPDSILSNKYKANYSITNPILKVKQTFDKFYYTNATQTKFIFEEKIE